MDNYPKERVPFQERLRLRNLGEFKAGEVNCVGRLSCMRSPWDSWPGGTRHCLPPLPFLCPWVRCPESSCDKEVLPLPITSCLWPHCTLSGSYGGKGPPAIRSYGECCLPPAGVKGANPWSPLLHPFPYCSCVLYSPLPQRMLPILCILLCIYCILLRVLFQLLETLATCIVHPAEACVAMWQGTNGPVYYLPDLASSSSPSDMHSALRLPCIFIPILLIW